MKKVLLQLLNSSRDGDRISSSYLWYHLGNIAATVVFIKAGWAMADRADTNVEGLSLLMFTYLGLITGNKLAVKFMRFKGRMLDHARESAAQDAQPKAVVSQSTTIAVVEPAAHSKKD